MSEEKKPEEMTFEESLNKLNELVDKLENSGLDLDENIRIYEQAVVLRDRYRAILEESERKVQKLMETAEGLKTEQFSVE
jgi:exodeoxyribonuclease VII small subunit